MKKENVKNMRVLDYKNEIGLFSMYQLPIFREYLEIEAKPTDLCLLTGGVKDSLGLTYYFVNGCNEEYQLVITSKEYTMDKHYSAYKNVVTPAIRPVIDVEEAPDKRAVYFGEYPLFVDNDKDIRSEILKLSGSKATQTGKTYCFDGEHEIPEYEYNGNKYVAVVSSKNGQILSDGTETKAGEIYIVKVSPVPWYVDKERKILLSVYALLSGVRFWRNKTKETKYEKSNMYSFINKKLMRDITNSDIIKEELDDELPQMLHITDEDLTKINISKLLNELKRMVDQIYPYKESKHTISRFVQMNQTISELPASELKNILYDLITANINSYSYVTLEGDSKNGYSSLMKTLNLLNDIIQIKSKTFDLSILNKFISAITKRLKEIDKNNPQYLRNNYASNWYMLQEYIDEILGILLLDDYNLISNRLKKFVIYDNKYNDLLIKLDIELGRYGDVKVAAR